MTRRRSLRRNSIVAFMIVLLLALAGGGASMFMLAGIVRTGQAADNDLVRGINVAHALSGEVSAAEADLHQGMDYPGHAAALAADIAEITGTLSAAKRTFAAPDDEAVRGALDDVSSAVAIDFATYMPIIADPAHTQAYVNGFPGANYVAKDAAVHAAIVAQDNPLNGLVEAVRQASLLELSRALTGQRRSERTEMALLVLFVGVCAVATLVFARKMHRHLFGPIAEILAAFGALGSGDLGTRVGVRANDEVTDLAVGFNSLAATVQSSQHELRMSESRFRSLVQHSSDLTVVCNRAGKLTYVSPASHLVLGRDDDAMTGTFLGDLVHHDDHAEMERALRGAVGHDSTEVSARVWHADGTFRRVHVVAEDLLDEPAVAGVVLHMRDTTERDRLEAELRHAQKLESVGQLAAGIAHEINTPIQFIGDNVRFLQTSFGELLTEIEALGTTPDLDFIRTEVPEAIRQTLDGVDRVAVIVRAMKVFGHSSNDLMAPADLNECVRNTLVVCANHVKYVADVVEDLGDVPAVPCYVGDINQVLLNLVVNAAQAIGSASSPGTRGTITVRTRRDGDLAVVEVIDDGPGIPEEIADRVFEPFFTTKEVGVGTGQGLNLAYSLIHDRHGGSITFTSQPGEATVFTIRLPLHAAVPVSL